MYTQQEKDNKFEDVCIRLETGEPLRKIFDSSDSPLTSRVFYELLNEDQEKRERYARAKEAYADKVFDEIIDIAEHTDEDHTPFTGGNAVQRDKLRIDARKWVLSKLAPKKYGDKLDIDQNVTGEVKVITGMIIK